MAEEVVESAGKVVGKATVKAFMKPSFDIVKVIPQGIIEIVMRGSAVALGLFAFISGAACQGAISRYRLISPNNVGAGASEFSAAGWVIFISFWVMVYQGLAILQLFLHVRVLYINVPYINWTIFFLVDIVAIGIAAVGYFCGAISMAAYAPKWSGVANGSAISSSAGASSAFCFFSLFLFIGMIVYFFLAKFVFLWPSHGDSAPAGRKSASKADDYTPEE